MYAFKYGRLFGDKINSLYNPNVRILSLNNDAVDDDYTTLTDLINSIKANERRHTKDFNWDLMIELSDSPGDIIKLRCVLGSYAIQKFENATVKEVYTASITPKTHVYHPRISRELFKLHHMTPEVLEYIQLLYGARPSKNFWQHMSQREYENILKYEALYMLDLDSREKATHLVTNDLRHIRIPSTIKDERNFAIIEIAKIAHPDIKPWQMKSMPRGYAMDPEVIYDAIVDTMVLNGVISTHGLKRNMVLSNAPSVLNKLKSMAAVVDYFNSYVEDNKNE